jgi:putative ABC transport system ATP-binding protein
VIESRGLQYAYPRSEPLRLGDVSVAQGGTLLLRGPSGSGKSTWLALAAGLLTPSAGEVVVAGQSVGALAAAARDAWRARHIGFLPQKLHLSEALTVADNLALAHFAAGLPVDRPAIAAALGALGLGELAARRPSQLSGGQAQRVAIARAQATGAAVVFADEPTGALDSQTSAEVMRALLDSTTGQGRTLVVVTHDAEVAGRCSRIVDMRDGRIVGERAGERVTA